MIPTSGFCARLMHKMLAAAKADFQPQGAHIRREVIAHRLIQVDGDLGQQFGH